jgi:hypothetical protein
MSHRLAITIAGAVSLGSFEAGVLFEVLDALGQHNQAAPDGDRIYIDVLTGASAGGMTAAITAQNLLYNSEALEKPYDNPFYNAWVAGVDIQGLLPLGASEPPDRSVLSSDFVHRIADRFLLSRYQQPQVPPASPHPAVNPQAGPIRLGLALSNLNGVDFARKLLSGGTFNYTLFQDQITFSLGATTDAASFWEPVQKSTRACGAFPFAFRPLGIARKQVDYKSPFLVPWTQDPQAFTYTDGGVFQNQPLGMAKNLVDMADDHRDTETRSYLFVSPLPVDPTLGDITEGSAAFLAMTHALVDAIYNQAGFRDWIQAESVNDAVNILNQRAQQLLTLLQGRVIQAVALQGVTDALLPRFQLNAAELAAAKTQLQTQFAQEYKSLQVSNGPQVADVWIDTLLVLELAADLHEKDEMYIYSVTANKGDLAGAGFFSFFGFLYRDFRDHDYDLGRQKAQAFLSNLYNVSGGKLPQLIYAPKPIHPIQPTPPNGFTPAMIPERNRKDLYNALAKAVDTLLAEMGFSWIVRKGVELFYVNGKLKGILGL